MSPSSLPEIRVLCQNSRDNSFRADCSCRMQMEMQATSNEVEHIFEIRFDFGLTVADPLAGGIR